MLTGSGVGNDYSAAGHIDCIIFSVLHIFNFYFENTLFHVANSLNILGVGEFFFRSETFARFLRHKYGM